MNVIPFIINKILAVVPKTNDYESFIQELKRIQKISLIKNPREDVLLSITKAYQNQFGNKDKDSFTEDEMKIFEAFIGKPRVEKEEISEEKDILE